MVRADTTWARLKRQKRASIDADSTTTNALALYELLSPTKAWQVSLHRPSSQSCRTMPLAKAQMSIRLAAQARAPSSTRRNGRTSARRER